MRKHKNKIIAVIAVVMVLAISFLYGGDAPSLHGWKPESRVSHNAEIADKPEEVNPSEAFDKQKRNEKSLKSTIEVKGSEKSAEKAENKKEKEDEPITLTQQAEATTPTQPTEDKNQAGKQTESVKSENSAIANSNRKNLSDAHNNSLNDASFSSRTANVNEAVDKQEIKTVEPADTGKHQTVSVSEETPLPVEPEETFISDKELTCTLSVRCDTILKNIIWLNKEKVNLVPEDGVIFKEKTVSFYEGESVFNLLAREMKRNKIHLEFEKAPVYNSTYIEGIANLYEFDCGELSGWMYKVNDQFPNYGCSRYLLKNGDKVEWVYTCDLGADVGGHHTQRTNNYE